MYTKRRVYNPPGPERAILLLPLSLCAYSYHVRRDNRCQESKHARQRVMTAEFAYSAYTRSLASVMDTPSLVVAVWWLALSGVTGGDCQRREMCVDRPWSSGNVDRARIVDAPLGSAVTFLCAYCGETDKGEPRFWYTSSRYIRGAA